MPTGYVADGALAKPVTVDDNATCEDDPFGGETVSSASTPLTDLSVLVDSQVAGGTHSSIVCVDATATTIGSAGTAMDTDDVSVDVDDLLPGTYTCTVVIDP